MGESISIDARIKELEHKKNEEIALTTEYGELQKELAKKQAQLSDKTKEEGQEPGE